MNHGKKQKTKKEIKENISKVIRKKKAEEHRRMKVHEEEKLRQIGFRIPPNRSKPIIIWE